MRLALFAAVTFACGLYPAQALPLILPTPSKITSLKEEPYRVPERITLYTSEQGQQLLSKYLNAVGKESAFDLKASAAHLWTAGTDAEPGTDYAILQPDAYTLRVSSAGLSIFANDEFGLLNALKTLLQVTEQSETINACLISDNPSYTNRALMIDMVRLKEKDHVYFDLLKLASDLKFNTLFLHFNDSNGCSIELKSRPELVTKNAMPQSTLKQLVALGNALGVRVVPEIESWGHAGWVTSKHPELAEPGSDSLCLSNPAIYDVLEDVIQETASLFPSQLIHIGCDEATYGKCDKCKAKIAEIGEGKFIASHINRVASIVRRVRKRPLIWSDVVARYPEALASLNQNVACVSWDYKETVRTEHLELISKNLDRELWVAPALVWGAVRVAPSAGNFRNVASSASTGKKYGAVGIETTIWLPQRYIPGTLEPGIVWAAEQSWSEKPKSISDVMAAYAAWRFGIPLEQADKMEVLSDLGDMSIGSSFWWKSSMMQSHGSEHILADLEYEKQASHSLQQLRATKPLVKSNHEVFSALTIAAKAKQQMALQRKTARVVTQAITDAANIADTNPVGASQLLAGGAAQIRLMESSRQLLVTELNTLWKRDRFEGPEMMGEGGGNSNLMWWFVSNDVWGYATSLLGRLQQKPKDSAEIRKLLEN